MSGPLDCARSLQDITRLEPLCHYGPLMAECTAQLLGDGVDPLEITQLVAHANDVLTGRLVDLAQHRLGPAPHAFTWLALGSHGRGEQVLSSDQDSALAYGGPPRNDADPPTYFGELSHLVVEALSLAGIPRCTGDYMATAWHHPLDHFVQLFGGWVNDPMPRDLLRAEVFLDVRPVHGDLDVTRLDDILVAGGRRGSFLIQMAKATVTFRPPTILFGRIHTDHGHLDVKRSGTAAIVLLARLYALAAGTNARTTQLRLEAAGRERTLSPSGVEDLMEAYRFLTGLRLRSQIAQAKESRAIDNRVRVDALTRHERRQLTRAVKTVRVMQQITAERYQTHTVT